METNRRGKKGVSDVYLIADARERMVIPFLETALGDFAFVQRTINTGDYLVCCRGENGQSGKILACIERKTYMDFASSFQDNRYQNVNKMLELRKKMGCQLYFFIEGPAFPAPTRRFHRIPYSCILAAITKLMVRHGIHVIQTENEQHSAKRLADLLTVFEEEKVIHRPDLEDEADAIVGGEDVEPPQEPDQEQEAEPEEQPDLPIPEMVTGRIEETDDNAAIVMWARLRGISVVLGKILTTKFSLAELAAQKVSPDQIRALKTATGRPITKDAVSSLLAVRNGTGAQSVKVVSGIKNISPKIAEILIDSSGGLSHLCGRPVEFLAAVEIPHGDRKVKFGQTRAERVLRILNYSAVADKGARPNTTGQKLGSEDDY